MFFAFKKSPSNPWALGSVGKSGAGFVPSNWEMNGLGHSGIPKQVLFAGKSRVWEVLLYAERYNLYF
jgi:hypothetical protein